MKITPYLQFSDISFAIEDPFDPGRSAIRAFPPVFMTCLTVARPRPEAPPVTKATTPRFIGFSVEYQHLQYYQRHYGKE